MRYKNDGRYVECLQAEYYVNSGRFFDRLELVSAGYAMMRKQKILKNYKQIVKKIGLYKIINMC